MGNDHLRLAKIKPENVEVDGNAGYLTASIQRFVQIFKEAAPVLIMSVTFLRQRSQT
jgi:hypothetical protein